MEAFRGDTSQNRGSAERAGTLRRGMKTVRAVCRFSAVLLLMLTAASCKKRGVVVEIISVENRHCVRSFECRAAGPGQTAKACELAAALPIECPADRVQRNGDECTFVLAPAYQDKEMRAAPVTAVIDCPANPTATAPSASGGGSAPCGALNCRAYDDLKAAFDATLQDKPLVVAIGEAHGKKGLESIDTSAKRFTRDVLPGLAERSSDLLLELMAPAAGCEQAKKETNKQLGKIAKNQAAEAPNEYIVLGRAAEKLGIKVNQLHPSCKQLSEIAASKSPPLTVLQTITALISHDAGQAVAKKTDDKLFLIFGGAFHTEPEPPEERAEFSFAAPIAKAAKGRYVSVHIFVREYIDPSWDIWQWYPQFKPDEHRDKFVVLHPKPQHYVIITAAAK